MQRLIDANMLIQDIENARSIFTEFTVSTFKNLAIMQPTVEAIPVEWILNNERMPTAGTGRKAIMDMLEDWMKEKCGG